MTTLTRGLLDDEAVLAGVPLDEAVAAHLTRRTEDWGAFVLPDDQLAAAGRLLADGQRLQVCAVSTSGAGSLLGLAGRHLGVVEVVAVRIALRDRDDLVANAARVVAAATALDERIEVRVAIPSGPGWIAAAEAVEAAGLQAAVGVPATAAGPEELAEQMSALVELDLPFTVSTELVPAAVLLSVDALVDGAGPAEAADLLTEADPARLRRALTEEDPAAAARIRRRLLAIGCRDVARAVAEFRRS